MKRWFSRGKAATPAPTSTAKSDDAAARRALDDLNSPIPRPMPGPKPFQRSKDAGYKVEEGAAHMVLATTAPVRVTIFCGNPTCRRRHLEPLADYASTAVFGCPRCGLLNVKQPLRTLLGRDPPDNILGQWGPLPPRRKRPDKF